MKRQEQVENEISSDDVTQLQIRCDLDALLSIYIIGSDGSRNDCFLGRRSQILPENPILSLYGYIESTCKIAKIQIRRCDHNFGKIILTSSFRNAHKKQMSGQVRPEVSGSIGDGTFCS